MGIQRCLSRSMTLAKLQGASTNSGEKSPPTLCPKREKAIHIKTRASKKLGVATPKKADKGEHVVPDRVLLDRRQTPTGKATAQVKSSVVSESKRVSSQAIPDQVADRAPQSIEYPKSPRVILVIHLMYCMYMGWSRP